MNTTHTEVTIEKNVYFSCQSQNQDGVDSEYNQSNARCEQKIVKIRIIQKNLNFPKNW